MINLDTLNKQQKEAVLASDKYIRIIAGAGSGKTRVLTTRIAYLILEKEVYQNKILAITFTNKAANEMKERIEKLIGDAAKDLWMGTFHSICVKILRRYIDWSCQQKVDTKKTIYENPNWVRYSIGFLYFSA